MKPYINFNYKNTTPICVQVHSLFHYILSEQFEQIYHDKSGQSLRNEKQLL